MPKSCGACGKFISISAPDSVRCGICSTPHHRGCVAIPVTAIVGASWMCPECKVKIPRTDNSATPVKGVSDAFITQGTLDTTIRTHNTSPLSLLDDTAHDETIDIKLDLALEIRSFRVELKSMRDEQAKLRNAICGCTEEVKRFQATVVAFDSRITEMEQRMSKLEQDTASRSSPESNLSVTVDELRMQLNDRDQEILSCDLEITGIPETKDESLHHIVKVTSTVLGVDLEERDVVYAERVGSTRRNRWDSSAGASAAPERPRAIAVRLARRATRDALLRAARVRRTLSSADLQLSGAPARVYLNERLTKTNRRLFFLTREAARLHGWKYVWTRRGAILERNGILPDVQSGFRKGHSTTTALLEVVDDVLRSRDAGMCTILALLDFSRAFDSISVSLLLSKLTYYGCDSASVRWFHSYLTGRSQFVQLDCDADGGRRASTVSPVTRGVPQGSILGPLLFILYSSDITKRIVNCRYHLYADDVQLFLPFKPGHSMEAHGYASTSYICIPGMLHVCRKPYLERFIATSFEKPGIMSLWTGRWRYAFNYFRLAAKDVNFV